MRTRRRFHLLIIGLAISICVGAAIYWALPLFAHGTLERSVSRAYRCYLENPENPQSTACWAAIQEGGTQQFYDWSGVNRFDANDQHRAIIPDGKLCSAGKESHKGLDLARDDWVAEPIIPDANGNFEFVFIAAAPHATKYFDFYVTKDGYDPTQPLQWSDLEEPPFCHITSVTLADGRYRMTCPLPAKSGKRVIYNIWQRSDSPEAFYTCMDVEFVGGSNTPTGTPPTPTPTRTATPTPPGGVACTVDYTITSDWGSGFQAGVTITNQTSQLIPGWTLSWNFAGNQQVTSLWDATHTQTGNTIIAVNANWNPNIAPNGGSTSFGFVANGSSQPQPATFLLNGMACSTNDAPSATPTTTTTATPTPTVTRTGTPSTSTATATATPTSGGPTATPTATIPSGSARRPFPQHITYAPGSLRPTNFSQTQMDQHVRDFYEYWKAKFLVAAGNNSAGQPMQRITFGSGNPDVTVSEGQGYGMVIVALMAGYDTDARALFDGLWRFVEAHPSAIEPRLMTWRVRNGVAEQGNDSAFDGDVDIAYGLLLAHAQWGSDGAIDYAAKAERVIDGILEATIGPSSRLPMLGDWVQPNGSPYNQHTPRSSDFMPAHFRAFGRATNNSVWQTVITNSLAAIAAIQSNASPNTGLLPDFLIACNPPSGCQPANSGFLEGPHDGHYYYNAGRDPWRIGLDALLNDDASARSAVQKMVQWVAGSSGGDANKIKAGYRLDGAAIGNYFTTFFADPFGVAAMTDPTQQDFLNSIYAAVYNTREDYYEDSVNLLSLLAMSSNWWDPTSDGVATPTATPTATAMATITPTATATKTATATPTPTAASHPQQPLYLPLVDG